ncbi:GNAT family N-acetyltransferase [Amycolatopsis sp. H20-H5]|uniref:GNAT family N-acetyltransferase n=1 Tax=Amycolatopsis sp. H20-H5 TaxID=3046309 RepID=UPI002DBDECE7|nr:GNAT family N-acetyltransferase [Amycolatopsis sp. H20-H5]MEC3980986.1 GNAT family N-acetyltransferase [Amycolatopsis sp. H20-H5]
MMDRRLAYDGPSGMGHWAIEVAQAVETDADGVGLGSSRPAPEVIGIAHLRPSVELPGGVAEIGYYVDPACGGLGYATEAASAVLAHGLTTLGLPAVWALVHESNVASLKVLERLGFLDMGGGVHYGDTHRVLVALPTTHGRPHHLELWVPDLARAERSWGWLLGELGWREHQRWPAGVSWKSGPAYLVVEQSPALSAGAHERNRPGLNHLALHVDTRARVDALQGSAPRHGWQPLFEDRYPYAGGARHDAAYWENSDGFEVELVALEGPPIEDGVTRPR